MNKGNLFFFKNIKHMKLHTMTPETSENIPVLCTDIQIRKS